MTTRKLGIACAACLALFAPWWLVAHMHHNPILTHSLWGIHGLTPVQRKAQDDRFMASQGYQASLRYMMEKDRERRLSRLGNVGRLTRRE